MRLFHTDKNTELRSVLSHYNELEDKFIESVNKKNGLIIFAGAVFCFFVELFNFYRVFFATASGLSSLNNRIYFAFYVALFVASIIVMCICSHPPRNSILLYRIHLLCIIFLILWNLLLNSYELARGSGGSNILFVTSLIFAAILFRFKLYQAIIMQLIAYLAFISLNFHYIDFGDFINISIIIVVTILCIILQFTQEVRLLYSQQELFRMNEALLIEEDNLRLELEKHHLIMQKTNLFSFDWNLLTDSLISSRNCAETLGWPSQIIHPIQCFQQQHYIHPQEQDTCFKFIGECIKNKMSNSMDIRLKDCSGKYAWYRLQLFVQCNHNQVATTAVGVLMNIDGTTRLIHNLNKRLQDQLTATKQYIEQLKSTQEQNAIYRHDMRHSLKLMEQLALQGNIEKLSEYLSQSHNKLDSITPNYHCENEIVNLILSSFEQLADTQNINFTSNVVLPNELPISDNELCSLLFNLLENAITAASHVHDNDSRSVHIQSIYKNKKFLIFTKNSFVGDILIENDIPISPFTEDGHGFGIKSIISIVDKYEGLYTFEAEDNEFFAKILLEI